MLIFLLILHFTRILADVCPFPSSYLDKFDGCVIYDDKAKTFNDAETECEKIYEGALISIHNIYQNAYVKSLAVNHNAIAYVAIGLRRSDLGSKNWTWTDGSATDYFSWARGKFRYDYYGTSQSLTSFCLFAPKPSASPNCESTWSHWIDTTNCTENCGGCGWKKQVRDCLSFDTCPCPGEDNRLWYCGATECTAPQPRCCKYHSPFINMTSKRYECQEDDDPVPTFETTPCYGTWSSWENVDYCSNNCGMCGWQPRERTCQPAGCLCDGPSRQIFPCNKTPCPGTPCCQGYSLQFDPDTQLNDCQPISPLR
ncbi:unnamed protein product, partial [Mesorhabditis belari]|uniref:C-type lectin domain-containing protein n=1 Tax=Mesorhabditis belari TaxID=2138241 RepID=A0AAF3JB40_9BILA